MFQILIKYIFENILLDWRSKKVVVLNGGMIRILTVKLIILFSAIEVEKFFFDEKYMPSFKKSAWEQHFLKEIYWTLAVT